MAAGFLFDLPRNFYANEDGGCVTDGAFDPEKAAKMGYSSAQFQAIEEFLGLDKVDTPTLPKTNKG